MVFTAIPWQLCLDRRIYTSCVGKRNMVCKRLSPGSHQLVWLERLGWTTQFWVQRVFPARLWHFGLPIAVLSMLAGQKLQIWIVWWLPAYTPMQTHYGLWIQPAWFWLNKKGSLTTEVSCSICYHMLPYIARAEQQCDGNQTVQAGCCCANTTTSCTMARRSGLRDSIQGCLNFFQQKIG